MAGKKLDDKQQASIKNLFKVEEDLVNIMRVQGGFSLTRSLKIIGLSFSAWHYRYKPRPKTLDPLAQSMRDYPNRISNQEASSIIQYLRWGKDTGLSVEQTFYRLMDQGQYLASLSTFMRLGRVHGMVGKKKRSRSGPRPVRPVPVLQAQAFGQVLCWDVTWLSGYYPELYSSWRV